MTLVSIAAFYYLEKRLAYFRLETYLNGHEIYEDIAFRCSEGVEIRLNRLSDSNDYIACIPEWTIEKEKLDICFSHASGVTIGDQSLKSGTAMADFASLHEGEPLTMKLTGSGGEVLLDGRIVFIAMSDLPGIYLTASENAMDIVNGTESGDIKPHVPVWIRAVDADGKTETIADARLFRRGNTTFDGYDPKPYNINLASPEPLLGMPSGRKWALKANAMDDTQVVRNKLAFNLSELAELEPCPDSRYVNLYINGRYNGLYLLSQRVDAAELMGFHEDEALLELDRRYEESEVYFVGDDEGIVVHYPEDISAERLQYLSDRYEEARQAVRDGDHIEDHIDIESFVKMYTIQDFMVQVDVAFSSLYFYLGADDRFHAGPVWDFDESCGMTASRPYHEELALRARLFDARKWDGTFFRDLARNEDFMQRVGEYYTNEFYDKVSGYMKEDWPQDMEMLSDAIYVNHLAGDIRHTGNGTLDSTDRLGEWVNKRLEYLDSYYSDPGGYAELTYHFGWGPMAAAVKRGDPVGFVPDDWHEGNDDAFWGEITGFADAEGNMVDDGYVPYEDADLYAVYSEDSHAWEEYSTPWME